MSLCAFAFVAREARAVEHPQEKPQQQRPVAKHQPAKTDGEVASTAGTTSAEARPAETSSTEPLSDNAEPTPEAPPPAPEPVYEPVAFESAPEAAPPAPESAYEPGAFEPMPEAAPPVPEATTLAMAFEPTLDPALVGAYNAAAPAMAQEVGQGLGQEAESGDVDVVFEVSSEGDFAQQCVAGLQFANTGNLQNAQGFSQTGSIADDVEFEGSSFEFAPTQAVVCNQTVQQAAAASSAPKKDVAFVPVEKKDVVFVPVEKKFVPAPVAEARAGETAARAGGDFARADAGATLAEADAGGAFANAGGVVAEADAGGFLSFWFRGSLR